jgi:hypothetical protein
MDSLAPFGYSNNHPDGVSTYIDIYRPRGTNGWLWGEVSDVVRSVVRAAGATDIPEARGKLGAMFRYVAWCHSVAGVELELPGVLSALLIDRYVTKTKAHCKENSRRRLAQQLRGIAADALRDRATPTKHVGMPPRASVATDADVRSARDWAAGLPSERLRHNADILVCLTTGAGLTTGEVEAARLGDFRESGDLLLIEVGSRTIPIRREWVDRLSKRLRPRGEEDRLLQWANEDDSTTHMMTMFHRIGGSPDPAALRAKYIVDLLNDLLPLNDILRVTGLQHAASLDRYRPFILPLDDIDELLAGTKAAVR